MTPDTVITVGVTAAVLVAGLLHATWNAMVQRFDDQWVSFALVNVGVAVPCLVITPIVGLPVAAAWGYLVAAIFCHLLYELFLMSAYKTGDLSRTYPIARGSAPILVALGGLVFANQHIGALAVVGVALIVGGIVSLALWDRAGTSRRDVLWSLATGVAISVYTVIDGLGVRASHNALEYTAALFALQGSAFLVVAFVRRVPMWRQPSRQITIGVAAGVISLIGYGIVLWAQTRAPFGVVSALRETGVLWAVVIGVVIFRERGGWRVVVSGALVLAGVATIALA